MSLYENAMDQIRLDAGVQEKLKKMYMNQRLDQTLKQTHVPEIDDSETLTMGKDRYTSMKSWKLFSVVAGAAACVALAFGLLCSNIFQPSDRQMFSSNEKNSFTLTVQAAELGIGDSVPLIIDGTKRAWGIGGNESNDTVNLCVPFPIICRGDNIESITYRINKGAFQVVEPIEKPIAQGENINEEYKDVSSVVTIGDYQWEKYGMDIAEAHYYTSFTIPYDMQDSSRLQINVCDLFYGDEIKYSDMKDIFFTNTSPDEIPAELLEKQYQMLCDMLGNTVVTCTVNYYDGTKDRTEISVNAEISSTDSFDENHLTDNEDVLYVAFRRQ